MSIIPPINMTEDEQANVLEELLKRENPASPAADAKGFFIDDHADRYVVHGLPKPYHPGETITMELSKQLLAKGNYHTQDQWQNLAVLRRIGSVLWEVPSAPEYASLIIGLYENKDRPAVRQKIDAIRAMLKADFDNYSMMTSTRTTYRGPQPTSRILGRLSKKVMVPEVVTHHYKRTDKPIFEAELFGRSFEIAPGREDIMHALIGYRDTNAFVDATQWLSGKKSFLLGAYVGFTKKPRQDESGVLVLGVNHRDRLYIETSGPIYDGYVARGVIIRDPDEPESVILYE